MSWCIIYSRSGSEKSDEDHELSDLDELKSIASVVNDFEFCWLREMGDRQRLSGQFEHRQYWKHLPRSAISWLVTACLKKLGEKWFDEYWMNYGKVQMTLADGKVEEG
ncbi:MAG: EcoRV family type II restriction endonuclease [Desulfosudis oleivorans]|nr:EcoRV family type II restriction endonuclease [Desulfosudis oleivorans]